MRTWLFLGILLATSVASPGTVTGQRQTAPALTLQAMPSEASAPATVEFVGELLGGPDDNDIACPSIGTSATRRCPP